MGGASDPRCKRTKASVISIEIWVLQKPGCWRQQTSCLLHRRTSVCPGQGTLDGALQMGDVDGDSGMRWTGQGQLESDWAIVLSAASRDRQCWWKGSVNWPTGGGA